MRVGPCRSRRSCPCRSMAGVNSSPKSSASYSSRSSSSTSPSPSSTGHRATHFSASSREPTWMIVNPATSSLRLGERPVDHLRLPLRELDPVAPRRRLQPVPAQHDPRPDHLLVVRHHRVHQRLARLRPRLGLRVGLPDDHESHATSSLCVVDRHPHPDVERLDRRIDIRIDAAKTKPAWSQAPGGPSRLRWRRSRRAFRERPTATGYPLRRSYRYSQWPFRNPESPNGPTPSARPAAPRSPRRRRSASCAASSA